jgi:hypothetical protein
MVEPQPSKLMMRVRFPLPAPKTTGTRDEIQGYEEKRNRKNSCISSLVSVFFAHIAQSAEHFLGKEEVTGSIPVMGSSIDGGFQRQL